MTQGSQGSAATVVAIRVSKSRRIHASIIAGLLAAIGGGSFFLGENYVPDNELIGIVCGGIAVAVLIVSRGAWTKGVAMTIDETGVWYRDWELPVVPWPHVASARPSGIRLRPLLRIELHDPESFFSGLDEESRRRLRGNTLVKSDHLLIPNGALELPIAEIATAMKAAAPRDSCC